jgi:hypothetical protein
LNLLIPYVVLLLLLFAFLTPGKPRVGSGRPVLSFLLCTLFNNVSVSGSDEDTDKQEEEEEEE